MSAPSGFLGELKIADVHTFLTVHRCGTISGAARELRVTPSQVSKSIARLEEMLGAALLSRSPTGVSLLDGGRRVLPQFEQMLALSRQLQVAGPATRRALSVAAPSYVASSLLPFVVEADPGFRIRTLELPPAQVRAHLCSGHFEVALSLGTLPLQGAWESVFLGTIEKGLFVSPETARRLGPPPVPRSRLAEVPFVSPIYLTDTGFLAVEDDCPISRRERIVGHETTTLGMALALVARSEQATFGPVLGAINQLRSGQVVKLAVEDWRIVDDLYLAYNTDQITVTEQRTLVGALEAALAEIAALTG